MTFNTLRNNVKPMFFGISFMVVILLRLFIARAFESVNAWHSTGLYFVVDGFLGFIFIGIT